EPDWETPPVVPPGLGCRRTRQGEVPSYRRPEPSPCLTASYRHSSAYRIRLAQPVEIGHWRKTPFPPDSPVPLPTAQVISTIFAWLRLPLFFHITSAERKLKNTQMPTLAHAAGRRRGT